MFLPTYDHTGINLGTHRFGVTKEDRVPSVAIDPTGAISGAGSFPGQTSRGGRDAFLIRFAQNMIIVALPVATRQASTGW